MHICFIHIFALNAEPLDWGGPLKAEIYIEKGTLDFFASVDPIEHWKDEKYLCFDLFFRKRIVKIQIC